MEKKINLFITMFIVLIFQTMVSQNTKGVVKYKITLSKSFTIINDSLLKTAAYKANSTFLRNYLEKNENAIKRNINFIETILIFNSYDAIYKIGDNNLVNEDNKKGFQSAKAISGSSSIYYYNAVIGKLLRQTEAYGQLFLIESKLNKRKWVLTQDSKTIGDYLCYKATSTLVTRNSKGTFYKPITAWYAPKLPVPYGPKGYGGLPGLIMQLTEGDFTFYISKLTLNPKKGVKIKIPTKGKKVSEEEFLAIGLQATQNFKKLRN